VTRRGVRVGIIGLCYPKTPTVTLPSNVVDLRFDDDSATAVPIVRRLRAEHADVVVGVGHIPGTSDSTRRPGGDIARLARGVPGVDAWFGGHSHNLMVGDVAGVPTMISGAHGQYVGVCDLIVDPVARTVIEHRARLVPTYADEVTPDSTMAARVQRWNADVAVIAAEPVGRNLHALSRSGGENTVGNFVTDAVRAATKVDIAFQNSGGLRADLAQGTVTRGAIYEIMPFDNTVVTMHLTGAEVRRALEEGLRTGRVAQVSGIRFTYDPDAPPMSRVVEITNGDGSRFDPERTYSVAVNNFMAEGGDDYSVFKTARDKSDTQLLVRDLLEQYVRERSAGGGGLDVATDSRVRRASASVTAPAR
jgi:2',3'-cyclic-nucleotide 2'-phosphodiesterase (5'-nucleotidase family)